MSNLTRVAALGFFLLSASCGPAPVEIAPQSQTSNLTMTTATEMAVSQFAYNYRFERSNLYSTACGSYRVDIGATFSQFPGRIVIESCTGPSGNLKDCFPLHEILCDLGTGACAAKDRDAGATDLSKVTLTPDVTGGYLVRVDSDAYFQGCSTYVPKNVRLRIRAMNSVQGSPWTEAGCSSYANPPLNHFQCR